MPKSVKTIHEGNATTLLNLQVKTDRIIPNNKLNITIRNNEKGTGVLIDDEISGDRNVIKKEVMMFLKYRHLTIEIQCMGNVKTKVKAVILGRYRRR